MERFPDFEEALGRLCSGNARLSRLELHALSGPGRQEAAKFGARWPDIPVEERQRIMRTLAENAEANFEMDFDAFFRCGLCDSDDKVRFHAVEGLWECEDPSLIDPLIQMLRHDPSPQVRAAAALSLGRFALLAELEELDAANTAKIKDALLASIADPDEDLEVSRRAVESISYLGIPEVREIIDRTYNYPDPRMRASAVFAMGRSSDPFWANTVMDELRAPEPEMRYEAARAAGELQLAKAVPLLIQMLQEEDREIQEAAIWALGQIGGADAKRALEWCLDACDDVLQPAIDEALGELALGSESLMMLEYEGDEELEDEELESADLQDEDEEDLDEESDTAGWDYMDLDLEDEEPEDY